MIKHRKLIGWVATLFSIGALLASPLAASASEPVSDPSTYTNPEAQQLVELIPEQTSTEIEEILESGEQVTAVYDVESGEFVAAMADPKISTFAITQKCINNPQGSTGSLLERRPPFASLEQVQTFTETGPTPVATVLVD